MFYLCIGRKLSTFNFNIGLANHVKRWIFFFFCLKCIRPSKVDMNVNININMVYIILINTSLHIFKIG
ncbi:hypothetical protein L1887_01340 [Cichorium endivia]|nr:hypothetical protein L1887_01340 [Cichorium endivia]